MPKKRLLMIAYHFPPIQGSSGVQRTLRFVRYLADYGWEPLVLTISPCAYEATAADQLADIPAGTVVKRAWGLDAARHLSIAGRYPSFIARPDRWASWQVAARYLGLQMIRHYRPHAIWSTYPIATAHQIGAALATRSRLPWIADFRDPMAQDDYPTDPSQRQCFVRLEQQVAQHAARMVMTTPGALRLYQDRFPSAAGRMRLIENGYDEAAFDGLDDDTPLNADCLTLLHSGIVYPDERDPSALIAALARLQVEAPDAVSRLRLRFRAPVHDALLRQLALTHGVEHLIEILPPIGYRDALAEICRADGLLILQAANCNQQIPAKLYEYLRAGRPIIALTDPAGDTAQALAMAGIAHVTRLDDAAAIAHTLAVFCRAPTASYRPDPTVVARSSRQARTAALAAVLDEAVAPPGRQPVSL